MPYETPVVGKILSAEQNTSVKNPGPVHDSAELDPWLQAQARDTSWHKNNVLIEEWQNAVRDNPPGSTYPANLGNSLSWAVVVKEAEAGGIYYDQQRVGPAVNTLEV